MSPHSITPESRIKVMRIKEVITNQNLFIEKLIRLISTLGNMEMYGDCILILGC